MRTRATARSNGGSSGQKRRIVRRRASGLPSIADIVLRCREPPQWAKGGHVQHVPIPAFGVAS
jgi:hypothetical protein